MPLSSGRVDVRLNLDLERIAQTFLFLELDRFGIVELRLADDVQRIFSTACP